MSRIVECVPNFSEGRRREVVDGLAAAAASVPGVSVLGCEMDADHNRSVLTFAGPPEAVLEAAFRCMKQAAATIDLRTHQGAHPRMGATDVVPFVPLGDSTMEECADLARRLGERAGRELSIPVYLYAEAASRPERRKLADVREGQFEGIRDSIATDPARAPDFGPRAVHPSAGATAVGARFFLIAWNVNLASRDLALAKRIAKAIREKDGGFPAVQAMGFDLPAKGMVQVSMNLLDYRRTGMGTLFRRIEEMAREGGAKVAESEIIGLVPRGAVHEIVSTGLLLDAPLGPAVVEDNLAPPAPADAYDAAIPLLDAVASDAPVPGGGSASAVAGAMAGALAAMVARLTVGREKYAAVQGDMERVLAAGEDLRHALLRQARDDAASYDGFMKAMKLPKGTPEEKAARAAAMEAAAVRASEVPLETARLALRAMEAAAEAAAKGNRNAASDACVATLLGRAALRGACFNVRINLPTLKDPARKEALAKAVGELEAAAEAVEKKALAASGL
ncbi:MAG: glutamate formimidoyltransferase [Planctomycetes bacterium]|nr:glutamate formimidoyltransferase [Planctomycetota bacterium]